MYPYEIFFDVYGFYILIIPKLDVKEKGNIEILFAVDEFDNRERFPRMVGIVFGLTRWGSSSERKHIYGKTGV